MESTLGSSALDELVAHLPERIRVESTRITTDRVESLFVFADDKRWQTLSRFYGEPLPTNARVGVNANFGKGANGIHWAGYISPVEFIAWLRATTSPADYSWEKRDEAELKDILLQIVS